MIQELVVLLDNREAGRVRKAGGSRLSFRYSDEWRSAPAAYPISLSMPLTAAEHGHGRIEPFLWGLLPDNERILEHWGSRFHVSTKNAFGLIASVGEDCAGAIQFLRPGRVEGMLKRRPSEVGWLDESGVAQRLRSLRSDPSAWRIRGDAGQFSLAGAQAKTALLLENGKWGVPSGRLPTTHILKPPIPEFAGHVENEHFCLLLARSLGLPVPKTEVMRFEDQDAIVIERYDRIRVHGALKRVHQEDMCQALGLSPTKKYENAGGPGVRQILGILRASSRDSSQDIQNFLDSLVFNWLIGGTDAHAKNYAVLLGAAGAVRLAPFYDIASVLPYKHVDPLKVKLAMKIGGSYRLRDVGLRHWKKLAAESHLDGEEIVLRARNLAQALPDHTADIRKKVATARLVHPIIDRLNKVLIERSRQCLRLLRN